MRFQDFELKPEIGRALDEAGYDTPTPIQERAIPILLAGRDLIGIAETGTGKTLAYLIPIFQGWASGGSDPHAVVVCPTRELAIQVAGEAERFGRHLGIRVALAYGGTSSYDQKRALAAGCDLLVATPGRLLDFLNSAWLSLRRLRALVLDEADRMLDMGFINDVDAILRKTPLSRQTMLFSATFPEEIRKLSERYMLHPETVRMHEGTRVVRTIEHKLYPVASRQKLDLLDAMLRRDRPAKVLIFCATREGTAELGSKLRRRGYEVLSVSSLLSQANRERALESFRSGASPVLVATDVAARGLDITDIDLVVNFDPPMTAEEYVHRIGRTGRAERSGRAATLVTGDDARRVDEIETLLGATIERVMLEGFDYEPIEPGRRGRGRGTGTRPRRSGGSRGARRTPATRTTGATAGEDAASAAAETTATKPARRRRRGRRRAASGSGSERGE